MVANESRDPFGRPVRRIRFRHRWKLARRAVVRPVDRAVYRAHVCFAGRAYALGRLAIAWREKVGVRQALWSGPVAAADLGPVLDRADDQLVWRFTCRF